MTSKYIGLKFNKLTILRLIRQSNNWYKAECKCDCGNICERTLKNIINGVIKSCGCTKYGRYHGLKSHVLNNTWKCIKARCNNKNNPNYYNYGGRGIKVCKEWDAFMPFYNWAIKNGWEKGLQIDRINNNKGYSPQNCRWATIIQQARNKRSSINIKYKGMTKNLGEWAEVIGMNYNKLYLRLFIHKWPLNKAFSKK